MNPLKHLDLMGTLVFVVTQLVGWAKPVPVDPRNFRNPKKDMAIVAAAGPLVNIIIAIVSAILFRLQEPVVELILNYQLNDLLNVVLPVFYMINISARINIALAIFNIIPIPPLDGGRMLAGVLSHEQVIKFSKIEPYGFIIIVVLLMSGIIGKAIFPIIMTITKLLLG